MVVIETSVFDSITCFEAEAWDCLLGDSDIPGVRHAFLSALELTGCASAETGWDPRFVGAYRDGRLVGAMPLYLKTHSYGEFIFDWGWADAARQLRLPYYPKLVSMVPFTPIGGRCFLVQGGPDENEIRAALLERARKLLPIEPATGLHLLFVSEGEEHFLEARGTPIRHTFQYHWQNEGYSTFEAFLDRFRSKRRAQIRRERRILREAGIRTRLVSGRDATPEEIEHMWSFYVSTVSQFSYSQRYLNRDFFTHVCRTMGEDIRLIFAELDGEIIAGTFNLFRDGVFYGRYWGCRKQIQFLHFELCCYSPVEFAIENGWHRVEAGAGGGHKMGRGFLPWIIRSGHEILLPGLSEAIEQFLEHERRELARGLERSREWILKPKPH